MARKNGSNRISEESECPGWLETHDAMRCGNSEKLTLITYTPLSYYLFTNKFAALSAIRVRKNKRFNACADRRRHFGNTVGTFWRYLKNYERVFFGVSVFLRDSCEALNVHENCCCTSLFGVRKFREKKFRNHVHGRGEYTWPVITFSQNTQRFAVLNGY